VNGDAGVHVWQVSSGNPLVCPLRYDGDLRQARFSPDGRRVHAAFEDGTVVSWDLAAVQPWIPAPEESGWLTDARLSPDGRSLVIASWTPRVWDAGTGKPVTPALEHAGGVGLVAFSPDGRRVVTSGREGTARVWDAATGAPLTPPQAHGSGPVSATFSPDGKRIVTQDGQRYPRAGGAGTRIGGGGTARVWDAASGAPLTPLLRHGKVLQQAVFSPDGTRLLTVSDDDTARLWDADSGRPVTPPLAHPGVHKAIFRPDGRRVVTAGKDRRVRVWDAATGAAVTPPLQQGKGDLDILCSPDGTRLLTVDFDTVVIRDPDTGTPLTPPLKAPAALRRVTLRPDGRRLLTVSGWGGGGPAGGGAARVWDVATGQPLTPLWRLPADPGSGAISADGRLVLTVGRDGVGVWDAATGAPLTPPLRYPGLDDAAFAADGRRLLTFGGTRAQVWDLTPDDRPEDDLRLLAEFLAGRRLDPAGSLVPLEAEERRRARDVLRDRAAQDLAASPAQVVAWDRQAAEGCEKAEQWAAAAPHLDRLIEANAEAVRLYVRRARVDVELGRWPQAADDAARRIELGEEGTNAWVLQAYARLALGDRAGHRRTCAALLARFGKDDDPGLVNTLAWTCVLAPEALADPGEPVRLAEKAVADQPGGAGVGNTLGVALYRAGKFEEAIRRLNEAGKRRADARKKQAAGAGASPAEGPFAAWDWLFLAMAHQRLGHTTEARAWLDRANGCPDPDPLRWDQRLELDWFRREAEGLIKPESP
jgi:WD40 repeat protein/tetratricopeptide (TPR) repeat protein